MERSIQVHQPVAGWRDHLTSSLSVTETPLESLKEKVDAQREPGGGRLLRKIWYYAVLASVNRHGCAIMRT